VSTDNLVSLASRAFKKKRARLLIGGLVVALAGLAIAASAGKYYCPECAFNEPTAFGDTEVFIRSEVNKNFRSWVDSKGNPLDVTICNGSQCATYLYVKLGSVFLLKNKVNSSWRGDGGGGGGGGGGVPHPGGGGFIGGGGGGKTPIVEVGDLQQV